MSRSLVEAEYCSMATTISKILWLRALLHDLSMSQTQFNLLFCDNHAALHIASNPVFHERIKHIEIDCYFVHDKLKHGTIKTSYVSTDLQLDGIFTKPIWKTLL